MTCNTARQSPARCVCGGLAKVDDWLNYKLSKVEMFVRCGHCGIPGPSADTGDEAIALWNAQCVIPIN